MTASIKVTESIVKPGLEVDAAFVPFRVNVFDYDTEAHAREVFERSFQHHTTEHGDVERDGDTFESQTSPARKVFVELTVAE